MPEVSFALCENVIQTEKNRTEIPKLICLFNSQNISYDNLLIPEESLVIVNM